MTEEFTPLTGDEAEANVQSFIDEHGLEGFLMVYFRQFLFRFVKQELQSADEDVDDVSLQLHFDTEGDEALQDKRERMRQECEKWAQKLVADLKTDDVVGEAIKNDDFERLWDEDVMAHWEEQLHESIEEWKDDAGFDDAVSDNQLTFSQNDMENS